MINIFNKKKLNESQLANVFVNALLDVVDKGFDEVALWINEESSFEQRPNLSATKKEHFLMIVIVGNLKLLSQHFDPKTASDIEENIAISFAKVFDMTLNEFKSLIKDYDSFMSKVNHPSRNTLYSMSKAVFHKYELYQFQVDYFKSLKTPNPVFLKKLDEIMSNFIWDWDAFQKKYKLSH